MERERKERLLRGLALIQHCVHDVGQRAGVRAVLREWRKLPPELKRALAEGMHLTSEVGAAELQELSGYGLPKVD